ncbi:MAG: FkbM family methyltransferase [Nostoc sp. DedVER02]|uniref:FkbM family methyltransferase n=1 Tax=unclassified Nostoc TaxID=2593658 RepID=UPI002AD20DCB|nr:MULTISPECIES: FkbM family methyltransferase [unclassified Nostoc]MDZ7987639.1 FkbM family methyltransferase [Nostoc sp. DedVER02]MDZ8114206.1 FkbM family methyltransferase [Nostoc sp. DedVER01b]
MKLIAINILRSLIGLENIPYLKLTIAKLFLSQAARKAANYDYLTGKVIKKALHSSSICVDIGCHHGIILGTMLSHCSQGRFFAFEPLPVSYKYLIKQFDLPNVEIFNMALSDTKGTAKFNYVVDSPAYSSLQKGQYLTSDKKIVEISVETDLLDNILNNKLDSNQKVSFIKIDVEGAELQVLSGAKNIIKRDKPIIIFEFGSVAADYYATKPDDIYNLLCLECELKISLLDSWLNGEKPLNEEEFKKQYYESINYYFIAYP